MRDCENCKHRVMKVEVGKGTPPEHFWGCECWECEFEPTTKNDLALIHTEGLDEEIRCTMCTNYMKSDRGCDGACVVNKDMYKAVMDAIEKRIQPSVTPQEPVLDKIRAQIEDYLRGVEITLDVLVENDPLRPKMEGAKDTLEECLNLIDKAETEDTDG